MILVELSGGLGNQMFEYALGRHLSILNNCDLKLDISKLEVDPLRDYALHCFNITSTLASEEETRFLKYGFSGKLPYLFCHIAAKLLEKLNLQNPLKRSTFVEETQTVFRPEILKMTGDVLLSGYWQTEKYFLPIRKTLLQEFSYKAPPDDASREMIKLIRSENSVSVHIRRGDYISNPEIRSLHCCCDESYYARAMAEICNQVSQPHFFVFSDEPAWVKENFRTPGKMTVLDLNHGDRGHEDMRLMSLCCHNVIANSSFSWWGAWLNENPHKIVIAPQRWFTSDQFATKDLLPEGWLKL